MDFLLIYIYRVVQKAVPQFYFCDNFRKCTPILIIFSLSETEIHYDHSWTTRYTTLFTVK